MDYFFQVTFLNTYNNYDALEDIVDGVTAFYTGQDIKWTAGGVYRPQESQKKAKRTTFHLVYLTPNEVLPGTHMTE